MRTIKVFFLNTVLFTVTNLILRAIGMWFNVYLSGVIGAQGIGVFTLVMNVYMFAASAAFAGGGFAATRLVAEELALGCTKGAAASVKKCLIYCFLCSLAVSGVIFFFADEISLGILKNAECIKSLRLLAFTFTPVSCSSVLRGYFNAVRKGAVTCAADFLGNLVRISVTMLVFALNRPQSIEYACFYLVFAMLVSEVVSFLCLALLYFGFEHRKNCIGMGAHLWQRLFRIAIPVAVSGFVKSGLSSFNQLLIPKGFLRYGMNNSQAMDIYGIIRGMVFPVLMFPSALLSALSTVLVPETAKLYASGKYGKISDAVYRVFYFTSYFGVFTAVVLAFFSAELGNALYKSSDAGMYLMYLAPLVVIMYFDETVDSILKGTDRQVGVVIINIIDKALCIILVLILIPMYGVRGYITVLYISEFFNGFLSIGMLVKGLKLKLEIFRLFVIPFILAIISYFGVNVFSHCGLILKISVMCVIYIILVLTVIGIKKQFFSKHT